VNDNRWDPVVSCWCEKLVAEAGETRTSAVGCRYHKTGEDTAGLEDLIVCHSEV
jgi:hypothetical protein